MLSLFFLGAVIFASETRAGNLPDSIPRGWRAASDNSPDVVIGTDKTIMRTGKASGFVERVPNPVYGAGSILQYIRADPYRNKRVRLTVYIKSKEVERAYLYMRVDGPDTSVAFANTWAKLIEETIDWTMFNITLDVPEESRNIRIGATLLGQGTIWLDDCKLEIVDKSIPSDDFIVTGRVKSGTKNGKVNYLTNATAMNLDFEDQ